MRKKSEPKHGKPGICSGFSLIELLVVMGVIALLTGLSIPALTKTLRGSNLNVGGRTLVDQLNLARQIARTRNLPVEVRLYKLADYGKPATDPVAVYRAFQIFLIDENDNRVAMAKPDFFLNPVIISSGTSESGFFKDMLEPDHAERSPLPSDPKLGTYELNYKYMPFQFTPSGATDLTTDRNFVTLILQNERPLSEGANFYTVQIDTISGSVRSFRP